MKRFLVGFFASISMLAGVAIAQNLDHYTPGFRTIDGSQLNQMVDVVNGLSAAASVVQGEKALDGANPTPVVTGLTTITGCTVSIKTATAPGVATSVVTYSTTGGTLNLYGWKVTATTDTTLIASTGTDTVGWNCSGTK